jgi:predicted metal-dependent phosphotriesterase family hydrolase
MATPGESASAGIVKTATAMNALLGTHEIRALRAVCAAHHDDETGTR